MRERVQVLKMFLVKRDPATGTLDFGTVAVLDAEQRSVALAPVQRLAPPDTPEDILVLRIRRAQRSS